jgi:chromate transporter
MEKNPATPSVSHRAMEVAGLFLKLGLTAFGGPAAHIAMMHDQVVKRRKWLDDRHFLDLLGATQLIPGPNSTEMAIHIGFVRAGWLGLIAGGVCFTLPATLIVIALSWMYVRYGTLPQTGGILYGIKPVIIAIILQALWSLGKAAVKSYQTAAACVGVIVLYFLGINEIALLFAGALAVMIYQNLSRFKKNSVHSFIPFPLAGLGLSAIAAVPFNFTTLFLTFLKIGAILYGSGYVLIAFLRTDLVDHLGWLTNQQLLDAIAIGQVTPGPLFTAATFIGYILGGLKGAILATLGIFLPSFIFVAISNPIIPRLRNSPWTSALLDGVNAASLGLMAAVTFQLGRESLMDIFTLLLAAASLILLLRYKLNSTWLILAGAIIGLLSLLWK